MIEDENKIVCAGCKGEIKIYNDYLNKYSITTLQTVNSHGIQELKLVRDKPTKIISFMKNLKIWNLKLEICVFIIPFENSFSFRLFQTQNDTFILLGTNLISVEKESIIHQTSPSIGAQTKLMNQENQVTRGEVLFFEKGRPHQGSLLNGFQSLQSCDEIKSGVFNIEERIKKNNFLQPFNFNFLHIGAILGSYSNISGNKFDWTQFETLKLPITPFA